MHVRVSVKKYQFQEKSKRDATCKKTDEKNDSTILEESASWLDS